MQSCAGCICLVLHGLDRVEGIWHLFSLLGYQLAAAPMFVILPSFQGAWMFSWVGGEWVYKCTNSAHYITSSLWEMLQLLVIWKMATAYSASFLLCWEDLLILGLQVHWYSVLHLLATPDLQKSRKELSPVSSVALCSGNGTLWLRNAQELHPRGALRFLLALGCWLDMTIEKMCLRLLRKLRANWQ